MNASLSPSATAPLLFHWERPRPRRRAIVLFILGSLIAHALCFYVFQIVYPPTVALLPPPARVSLITADSEEGRSLLRWIEAEDPALAFATHRPPEARLRALPKLTHVPSYLTKEPILKQAPPPQVDLRPPSSNPSGPVPIVRRSAMPATGPIPTTVSFSNELETLGAPTLPTPKFAASNNTEAAQNVRFRVAVNSAGVVRYCFPLDAAGDPALDEQARNYLVLCRFPARAGEKEDESLVWGTALVEWGNDVARPPAPSKGNSP
ncbi:MAG: hypothetical protein ABI925_07445 [Verrucomicrobiota bacterium]